MKNLTRGLVVLIALSGFAASTVATSHAATARVVTPNVVPWPACAPSDPSACGLQ